jgi:SAM-dependent methyltransferase
VTVKKEVEQTQPALAFRPVHPFPARMAPAIVWEELGQHLNGKEMTVLDPMTGSGTTLVTARLLGHHAIGFDTDPLAVLIAKAWSVNVDPDDALAAGARVLRTARRRAEAMRVGDAYPQGADEPTRAFVRYWFDETPRKQLTALAEAIADESRHSIRGLLWCAFSRLIIVKSVGASLAMDVAHSRPHKVHERAPLKPFNGFERALRVVVENSPFSDGIVRPRASVKLGDARTLPLSDHSVDMVVTSPPYLNAIDYLRGHKFSLIWMGHGVEALRDVRSTNVGTEVGESCEETPLVRRSIAKMGGRDLPRRQLAMLRRYTNDMLKVLSEVGRVLRKDGRAILVVGNSTLRGHFIANSRGLEVLGESAGLTLVSRRTRPLPGNRRYLPPPGSEGAGEQLESRMREEVILTFSN